MLGRQDPDGIGQAALHQPGSKRRRYSASPQHASKRHPGAAHPVDLVQGDPPLWLSRNRQGHIGGAAPVKIAGPFLR
jgi:hypothetical protein